MPFRAETAKPPALQCAEGFMAGLSGRTRQYHSGGLAVKDYIAYLLGEIKVVSVP